MSNYYYALYLNSNSIIEKYLALLRHISNPGSKSLPHVTLFTFSKEVIVRDMVENTEIPYINIIGPGTFNLDSNSDRYVVYLRCESEELDIIQYKPDFPSSRMHITIYEGNDYLYAKSLYELLNQYRWNFQLDFLKPQKLVKNKIGGKKNKEFTFHDVESVYNDVLKMDYGTFVGKDLSSEKLRLTKEVLRSLSICIEDKIWVESYYLESVSDCANYSSSYIDQNYTCSRYYKEINDELEYDIHHITPPDYAKELSLLALKYYKADQKDILFGDPEIGTGMLFLMFSYVLNDYNKKNNTNLQIKSSVGVEVDKEMSYETFLKCAKRGLTVINGDILSPEINLGSCRNVIIANPPYLRNQQIDDDYKEKVLSEINKIENFNIKGSAALYVYHFLSASKWLCTNGISVWLLPLSVMFASSSRVIREFLLRHVSLLQLHVYNIDDQFENANVSTVCIVYQNNSSNEEYVNITTGVSSKLPEAEYKVSKIEMEESINNWLNLINIKKNGDNSKNGKNRSIMFEDAFVIKRGIATGSNSFFVIERAKAFELDIPNFAMKPIIPKIRSLKSDTVNAQEDGFPDTNPQLVLIDTDMIESEIEEKYPKFYEYLQEAKKSDKNGNTVIQRTLVKNRKIWYQQEQRDVPVYLLSYMGRSKNDGPALRFIRNKSIAVALNNYYLLYPKKWLNDLLLTNQWLYDELLSALNYSSQIILESNSRIYSGKLHKIEPNDLKQMPIIGLDKFVLDCFNSLDVNK